MIPAIQMTEGPVRVSPGDICCRVTDAWRHMRRTVVGNSSKGIEHCKACAYYHGKGVVGPRSMFGVPVVGDERQFVHFAALSACLQ
ncbi:hypothetical protein RvY_08153-4 [Ramazzottius varieornatus]|uniref:Uncharacterized protein n=1 Tax=Ramazzottius varieornatus TaxID=947166 RepID=A0A1D1V779_RAMVA|nr:hypothetical protein RvY_08153-4 [Ramazzottius varieornatus]